MRTEIVNLPKFRDYYECLSLKQNWYILDH